MQPLELIITTTVVVYWLWVFLGTGLPKSLFSRFPFVTAGLIILHLVCEGGRWPMIPLYLLVGITLASYPWCRSHIFRVRLRYMIAGSIIGGLLLAGSCIAGGVFWPVFQFSPLTGPYPVGCVRAHLEDQQRTDPYAPSASDRRELMIEVWYPAASTHGYRLARYRDGRTSGLLDSSIALVKTRSYWGAPIATSRARYPVLLFSGPMNRFQNTFETEELASHGFIVAAIDHPYDSDLVVFPDGRRIYHSDKAEYLDYTSEAALRQSRSRVERRLAVRVADAQFVLDELTRWNTQDHGNRFFGRIDLHHIGIFGHSFGGAVAAELCRVDPRLGAGVNMDGTIFGTAKIQGIPKPYLVMFEGTQRPSKAKLESGDEMARRQAHDDNEDYDDVERTLSRYGGYFVQIPGISHMGFTDYPLHSQLGDWSGARILTVRRAHEMINRVTLVFFQRELLKDPSAAVEAVTRSYKGVILQSRQPGVQFSTNNANTSPSR